MTIPEGSIAGSQCGGLQPDLSLGHESAGGTNQCSAVTPPGDISPSGPDGISLPTASTGGSGGSNGRPPKAKSEAQDFFEIFPRDIRRSQTILFSWLRPVISLDLVDESGEWLSTFRWDYENRDPKTGRFHLVGRMCSILPLWIILHHPWGGCMTFLANRDVLRADTPLYKVQIKSEIDPGMSKSSDPLKDVLEGISSKKVLMALGGMSEFDRMCYDMSVRSESRCLTGNTLNGIDLRSHRITMIATTDRPDTLDSAVPPEFLSQEAVELPDADARQNLWDMLIHGDVKRETDSQILAQISQGLSHADIAKIGMSARSHYLDSAESIRWPELIQCVISSSKDKPKLVTGRDMSPSEMETLRETLRQKTNMCGQIYSAMEE